MTADRQIQERQHVASVIRAGRLRHGWKVGEAAERVGVDQSTWSKWETATTTPRPEVLKRIGDVLELPEDWMVPATLSQPSRTVNADELLETIRRELAEHEARVEAMLARFTGGSPNNDDGEQADTRQEHPERQR